MSQKTSTLLCLGVASLAIGAASLLGCQDTWARSYSFTDVAANLERREAIMEKECQHDIRCEQLDYESNSYSSFLALATKVLNEQPIFITSVNPATLQIRFFFNDHPTNYLERENTEDGQHFRLQTIWIKAHSDIVNNAPNVQYFEPSEITPKTEISAQMENLEEFEGHLESHMSYNIFTTKGFNTGNSFYYNDCISSPSYRPGMECRLYFTDTKPEKYSFLPTEPGQELEFDEEPETFPEGYFGEDLRTDPETLEPDHNDAGGSSSSSSTSGSTSTPGDTDTSPDHSQAPSLGDQSSGDNLLSALSNQAQLPGAPNTGLANISVAHSVFLNPTSKTTESSHPSLAHLTIYTLILAFLNLLALVFRQKSQKPLTKIAKCDKMIAV